MFFEEYAIADAIEKTRYEIKGCIEDFQFIFPVLMRASYSIYESVFACTRYAHQYIDEWTDESMEDVCTESFVTSALSDNVINDRLTGNSEEWGRCEISISSFGVEYSTSGGVHFGWDVYPEWNGDTRNEYTLVVYCLARPGGTLEQSLIEYGFLGPHDYDIE